MENFLHGLLCKRSRRQVWILLWNSEKLPLFRADSFEEYVETFLKTLLYSRFELSIQQNGLKVFGVFQIPYNRMYKHELQFIRQELFRYRTEYFRNIIVTPENVNCYGYKGTHVMSDRHRRELARDFLWLLCSKKSIPNYVIVGILQKMLEKQRDPLLLAFHEALQGRCRINEITV
jgi:hypothetical protein